MEVPLPVSVSAGDKVPENYLEVLWDATLDSRPHLLVVPSRAISGSIASLWIIAKLFTQELGESPFAWAPGGSSNHGSQCPRGRMKRPWSTLQESPGSTAPLWRAPDTCRFNIVEKNQSAMIYPCTTDCHFHAQPLFDHEPSLITSFLPVSSLPTHNQLISLGYHGMIGHR